MNSRGEFLDVEVGRHAIRTFKLHQGRLRSVYQNYVWENGAQVAKCLADPFTVLLSRYVSLLKEEERCLLSPGLSPGKNCSCGIYGALTLESLWNQYLFEVEESVAVFAAEGETIIGDKGLRTEAARIVAYWCPNSSQAKAYKVCEGAKRYRSLAAMCKDYDIPTRSESGADVVRMIDRGGPIRWIRSLLGAFS